MCFLEGIISSVCSVLLLVIYVLPPTLGLSLDIVEGGLADSYITCTSIVLVYFTHTRYKHAHYGDLHFCHGLIHCGVSGGGRKSLLRGDVHSSVHPSILPLVGFLL